MEQHQLNNLTILSMLMAVIIAIGLIAGALRSQNTQEEGAFGKSLSVSTEYTDLLFDDGYIHTINLILPDLNWDYMTEHATEEAYVVCDAVIDGERIANVGLRPKGNSSLSAIAASGSDHFSFKIEFDHYKKGNTYHGLDKLSLNNLGQDLSCVKDYFAYHMMNEMGVAAPLSAYTLIQVNGEDFGLYLAVEAVEDSFCLRNYGNDYGKLYRPDVYAIETIKPTSFLNVEKQPFWKEAENATPGQRVDILGQVVNYAFRDLKDQVVISAFGYAGDEEENYSEIFDTAVFPIKDQDKRRYIDAVRTLNTGTEPAQSMDVDQVINYFVVHNFLNNYDSYSSVFVHNFYLHEKDGKLSLVPWDYNLCFGAFSVESAIECFFGESKYHIPKEMGQAMSSDKSYINYPIDTPCISSETKDRPLINAWINDPVYNSLYHERFDQFLAEYFENGYFDQEITRVDSLIRPYIQRDLTFYTEQEYDRALKQVKKYGQLRTESIRSQLSGEIPSTLIGQVRDYENLVEIGDLNLGYTIDFGGLAWGITSKDFEQVMDALAGDHEHTTEGLGEALAEMAQDSGKIPQTAVAILQTNDLLGGIVARALKTTILFLVSVLVLIIAVKIVKQKGRRH